MQFRIHIPKTSEPYSIISRKALPLFFSKLSMKLVSRFQIFQKGLFLLPKWNKLTLIKPRDPPQKGDRGFSFENRTPPIRYITRPLCKRKRLLQILGTRVQQTECSRNSRGRAV
ncbi:hypothetical protein NPIL_592631 [Nephila pilipes]|uniref:Uncharacterized protein n=1 Tax=Nephila pilipes TaxID=299642 RepID=A0A8X6ULT0_NEPPI|nr:hypothetical protein NPIL_592631 [Nephila pilipes]